MDYGISGRVIVVTGGASGIGLAVAREAARNRAHVAILDSSAEQAEKVAAGLRAEGAIAAARAIDVRDQAACEQAAASVEEELGPIDGIVASAGVSRPEPADIMSAETWDAVIGTNLSGMFFSVRPVAKRMIARRKGAIVAIASVDGMAGHAARSHYAASKHGVLGLVRSWAVEWGRHGVRSNAVAPGVVDTPLLATTVPPEHVQNAMIDRIPLCRLSKASEQAHACLFLLSDGASYINGATLVVDGGLTSGNFTRWNGGDYGSRAMMEKGLYGPPSAA
jgi:NAD(P)-dependent dehydrogenase (short-subunit alcohol dehydrogenase family)